MLEPTCCFVDDPIAIRFKVCNDCFFNEIATTNGKQFHFRNLMDVESIGLFEMQWKGTMNAYNTEMLQG